MADRTSLVKNYGFFSIDRSNPPYVFIRTVKEGGAAISSGQLKEEEWLAYERAFRGLYADAADTGARFCLVFQLNITDVPFRYVRRKAKLLDELAPQTRQVLICTGLVIESTIARALFKGYFAVRYNAVRPMIIVATMEEAMTFVRKEVNVDRNQRALAELRAARKKRRA